MEQKLVFVDIESAGLDPKKHPIIQLAALAVNEGLEVEEAFDAKIHFDEKKASADALRKNHYHPGVWQNQGQPADVVAREFAAFLRRHASVPMLSAKGEFYRVAQLVAHNAAFDGPFLFSWFEKQGAYLPARRLVLCTMQLAMWQFWMPACDAPTSFKLADLCEHFGVSFHAAQAHDALADVTATLKLIRAMTKRNAEQTIAVRVINRP